MLSFAKWLFGANLFYMVFQRLDLYILARYLDVATLGQYGAALKIVAIASLMTGVLSAQFLPQASRTRGMKGDLRGYIHRAFSISLLLTIAIGGLWFITPWIVYLLFGKRYMSSIPLARIILIGTVFVAIYTPFSQLFLAEEDPRKMFYLSLLKLLAIGGLGLVLVPRIGARGAAWSLVLAEGMALVFTFVSLRSVWTSLRGSSP